MTRVALWPVTRLALGLLSLEGYPPQLQFGHVSCCSQYMVDKLTSAGAIPLGAVVILNGIDPAPFVAHARQMRDQDGIVRLLYFGGLMEHKGVHTAIEALGILKERGLADRLRLTIVGGGEPDYEKRLRRLVQSLALDERVQFTGRVTRSEIPQILGQHDIFLFTSIWAEPFGRTIIEAMAAGLAVVGSRVGGSQEIFEFYPGDMLFEPGDSQALADQVQKLVDDPELLHRLGEAGRALVLRHFTLERMVGEIEVWLGEVVR